MLTLEVIIYTSKDGIRKKDQVHQREASDLAKTSFITITGINHYYEQRPFEIGRVVKIVKEPENTHDSEAIRVELPFIGKIGYVANSSNTVYRGTISAGRLYDEIGEYAYAHVLFITHSSIIAAVLSPEEVETDADIHDQKKIILIDDEPVSNEKDI